QNGAHLNATGTAAWQTSALLLTLTRDGNDTITVGSGNNVVIGQGGNNTITAGNGNNLIFGNNALNTTPTQDDLPHVIDAVVVVGAAQGTSLSIPTDGQLVVPSVNLLPSALTPSAPQIQYGLDGYGTLSGIANGGTLARTDGASLAVLASIVPDMLHGSTALPGSNTITVGAGNNTIFGNSGEITVLPATGIASLGTELQGLSVSIP